MADVTELRECRWCEDDDLQVVRPLVGKRAWSGRAVQCRTCGAQGPVKDTEAEAVAAWNKRVSQQPAVDREALVVAMARALYEHWCAEVELRGVEMAPWEKLGEKQTWTERAQAALSVVEQHLKPDRYRSET
jgi:hypothetical protein